MWIAAVPLLHGETVLKDFQGEGGCCGISCECCPSEYGRLTSRRIIVLQQRSGPACCSLPPSLKT